MSTTLSVLGILLGLALIMFLVLKRFGIIFASIAAGIVVALFSSMNVIDALNKYWLVSFANFFKANFLLFAFSALFGKVMEDTGAAAAVAQIIYKLLGRKYAIYGCMLATGFMVYGGISAFVVIFTVYPIFMSVMKECDIPRRLAPAIIFGTAASWSSCILPGSIDTHNLIPINYLHTTAMAAPAVGIVCSVVTMILQFLWFNHRIAKARANGDHFEATPQIEGLIKSLEHDKIEKKWLSIIPIMVMLIALNVFNMNPLYALLIGSALGMVMFWKNINNKLKTTNVGLANTGGAIIDTSAAVAFGGIVTGVTGYNVLVHSMMAMGGSPLISFGIGTAVLGGVSGSGLGGLGIAMQSLAPKYLELGCSPIILHRIAAIACVAFTGVPHCGLVVTMLSYCGVSYKEGYWDIVVVTIIISSIITALAITMGVILY